MYEENSFRILSIFWMIPLKKVMVSSGFSMMLKHSGTISSSFSPSNFCFIIIFDFCAFFFSVSICTVAENFCHHYSFSIPNVFSMNNTSPLSLQLHISQHLFPCAQKIKVLILYPFFPALYIVCSLKNVNSQNTHAYKILLSLLKSDYACSL